MRLRLEATLALCALLAAAPLWAGENPLGRTSTGDVGDVLEVALPATAVVAAIAHRDWEGARQYTRGAASALAITYALKDAVGKERPDGRSDDSFPSGHTAVAMHAASHLRQRYGLRWGIPAYLAATYVGYSRVYDDRHYENDVLVGAALGLLSARLFTRDYHGVRFSADVRPGFYGLKASVRLP